MNKKSKHIRRFILTYVVIALLAILGLNVTIKTLAINKKMLDTQKQITLIRDENKTALLQILAETSLDKIESVATEKLHMELPKKIDYLYILPKKNDPK